MKRALFAVLSFKMTLYNITLELLKKYQTIEGCISCNEKVLEKLKISTGKQELVDFVEVTGKKSNARDSFAKYSYWYTYSTEHI